MVKHIPSLFTVEIPASWIARVLVVLTVEIKAISNITIWDWKVRLKTDLVSSPPPLIGTNQTIGSNGHPSYHH